jgi:adenosine deaminase
MLEIGRRNGLDSPFRSVEEARRAYDFDGLSSFLAVYYQGIRVLRQEQDFYDLTRSYLSRARTDNLRHVEIFFDPQAHTARGVPFEAVVSGIHRGLAEAREQSGISSRLIMCFLRDRDVEDAKGTLQEALAYRDWITGVGLDSAEIGHPPEKFQRVFQDAREEGLLTVAHAGEEGPPEYIWQALNILKVSRIDHGVRCIEDSGLVEKLVVERVPLTVCPLSNVRLRVFNSMGEHVLKRMLDLGLLVTVNSDDPAYFGGYISDNFLAAQQALGLGISEIHQLVRNSCEAAFLTAEEKQLLADELQEFISSRKLAGYDGP